MVATDRRAAADTVGMGLLCTQLHLTGVIDDVVIRIIAEEIFAVVRRGIYIRNVHVYPGRGGFFLRHAQRCAFCHRAVNGDHKRLI